MKIVSYSAKNFLIMIDILPQDCIQQGMCRITLLQEIEQKVSCKTVSWEVISFNLASKVRERYSNYIFENQINPQTA